MVYGTVYCLSRYLALVSALASGADWLFIPEAPPKEGWEDRMCARLEGVRRKQSSTCLRMGGWSLPSECVCVCLPAEPYDRVKAQHHHHR